MPRRDPFTAMCQQFADLAGPIVADLHAHTTASDGDDTPSRLALRAKQARLSTIAITDHDTLAGIAEAKTVLGIEIVSGVELSCWFRHREVHLLGLFVEPDHEELTARCREIGESRLQRFRSYIDELTHLKITIPGHRIEHVLAVSASPGRRHVANLIREAQSYRTRHAIFSELLPAVADKVPPKLLLPIADAIAVIHRAKGIAVLAHPPGEFDDAAYRELAELKIDGVESKHPGVSPTQTDFLNEMSKSHGWVCSAGSDYHGSDSADRGPGRIGMNAADFADLRRCIGR